MPDSSSWIAWLGMIANLLAVLIFLGLVEPTLSHRLRFPAVVLVVGFFLLRLASKMAKRSFLPYKIVVDATGREQRVREPLRRRHLIARRLIVITPVVTASLITWSLVQNVEDSQKPLANAPTSAVLFERTRIALLFDPSLTHTPIYTPSAQDNTPDIHSTPEPVTATSNEQVFLTATALVSIFADISPEHERDAGVLPTGIIHLSPGTKLYAAPSLDAEVIAIVGE